MDFVLQGLGFDFKPYVQPIYNAIMSRLTNQDQDQVRRISFVLLLSFLIYFCFFYLNGYNYWIIIIIIFFFTKASLISRDFLLQEVKECAISCMGLVISTFGDNLGAELPACLPVLVDRMGNEITRLTAVKVCLLRVYWSHDSPMSTSYFVFICWPRLLKPYKVFCNHYRVWSLKLIYENNMNCTVVLYCSSDEMVKQWLRNIMTLCYCDVPFLLS